MTLITSVETREISSGDILAVEIEIDPPVTSVEMQELGAPTTEITFVGLQGPPGPGVEPYVHIQSTPAMTWVINHNLGYTPTPAVFSVGGLLMSSAVENPTVNQTLIQHVFPIAGYARLL